ncbi:hypothetical protein PC116_g10325 [Phytophthora cactorum]|uniref:Uncharacterized protein n=2 Tax=Phytophthora cactorum TaxID=29920 RepID=A0A8T1KZI4_9STRA|nr:hypothetical protein Pcac1_g18573 [Phytophthora cactorum]KAG2807911.1 hypothetical protein PC111_g16719 [Phytophthora cactorum]KAG2854487.1 hypothetical protein PC113_g13261 [Phytophthora cactorum]KAG2897243.1 hypothetical protein PC114_g14760 [Phytophthora cactorum]KAG2910424.1 hypothetical protein PC115_g12903 [Phytophthora cactorum]
MNWMTSGKHRALYSQRGRRRQMHFPSQVQHQRVKPTSPSRSSQPRVRDSAKPWYIVSIGDDDESQDIRVLELERKGAMSAAGIDAEEKVRETARVGGREDAGAPSSPRQKRGREQEQSAQDGRSENRCIFTPVKKTRKYGQPPGAAQLLKSTREERPPSSIASGVDMLFFNDGEELPHKNRALRTKQVVAEPVPQDAHINRLSQHISDTGEHDELRLQHPRQIFRDENLHGHSGEIEAHQQSPDSDTASFHGRQAFTASRSEADQRDYQLWRVNSCSCAGSSPDTAFSRPDSGSFGNAKDPIYETFLATPPSSPFEASPLPFKMSRAEVLQSQLSTRLSCAEHDQLESRMSFTPSPRPSPSPSTSTSSQGSIVLGRPPLGWQKKLLLALEENPSDKPENRFDAPFPVSGSPRNLVDSKLENVPLELPPSPSSSRESDSANSITSAVIPVDAKERILAATASQAIRETSPNWYSRPTMTNPGNATSTQAAKSTAFQQSWVMSSRTKTILDAVSSSKASSMENAIEKRDNKYLEMESVAIYMYTLVQCYKIDVKLRTDNGSPPVADLTQQPSEGPSTPTATTLTKQKAGRREIIFSPKRAR